MSEAALILALHIWCPECGGEEIVPLDDAKGGYFYCHECHKEVKCPAKVKSLLQIAGGLA